MGFNIFQCKIGGLDFKITWYSFCLWVSVISVSLTSTGTDREKVSVVSVYVIVLALTQSR